MIKIDDIMICDPWNAKRYLRDHKLHLTPLPKVLSVPFDIKYPYVVGTLDSNGELVGSLSGGYSDITGLME